MKKDIVDLCGVIAETERPTDTAQTAAGTTPPRRRGSRAGYKRSRFNAVRHAVLSVHTVLPWEDEAEYLSLLGALVEEYAPQGPTEVHLVEEIVGIIWRKRRLRLAEAASYQRGLKATAHPFSDTLSTALIQVECSGPLQQIVDAVTATPSGTAKHLIELKRREASAQKALEILTEEKAGAYEAALAELDESTLTSWQEEVDEGIEDFDEGEDVDVDATSYTADASGLAEYLERSVLPFYAQQLRYLDNRPLIRTQVLGEAFDPGNLERLSRYEVHLDRKLERMLTMLLRLQGLRDRKSQGMG